MHYLYAPLSINGAPFIAKLTVEEFYNEGTKNADRKAFHLQGIKIESAGEGYARSTKSNSAISLRSDTDSINSISDLFKFVKTYDKEFTAGREISPEFMSEFILKNNILLSFQGNDYRNTRIEKSSNSTLFGLFCAID